jgi:hypothetical protein
VQPQKRIALITCGILLLFGAWVGAETVITSSGSVLQGAIEFGIPAVISVTSSVGDVFTVQRTNLKAIRFPEEEGGEATVETFDGNILIGAIGGVPDVIGLRTVGGDVQSVQLGSIVEIRFEPPTEADVAAPLQPLVSPPQAPSARDVDAIAQQVVDTYRQPAGALTIGLDTGIQLGFTSKNGFNIPRFSVGVNALTFGVVWRSYFGPPVSRVERIAREIAAADATVDLESITVAVAEEITPFVLPYVHLATAAFIIPELGGGVLLRLGQAFYIDLGASIDLLGIPWFLVGILIVF